MAKGFEKGHTKIGGKIKGSENKSTAKAKELVLAAIDEQSVFFNDTMAEVRYANPTEWAKLMIKLMDFVLPKKIDMTTDGDKINNIPLATWMPKDDTTKSSI